MEIGRYERPRSMEEAGRMVLDEGAVPLGGGVWTNAVSRPLALALELSGLGLSYVEDRGREVAIGVMATLRRIETHQGLDASFGGLFSAALAHVGGVQVRNAATAGGTAGGKFGFSDLNTVLSGLGATAVFHDGSSLGFAEFLEAPRAKPFLIKELLVPKCRRSAYQALRVAANDFPVLNACAAHAEGGWRIAVGARPAAARLCLRAAAVLDGGSEGGKAFAESARRAGLVAAEELKFGDDTRGSAAYRKEICAVLVKRAILEAERKN